MKKILPLILLFFFIRTYSQGRIDIGNGGYDQMAYANYYIGLFEQNKIEELKKYFSRSKKFNLAEIKKESNYFETYFTYFPNSQPPYIQLKESNIIFYERTYFEDINGVIKYLFQIYIQLEIKGKEILISELQIKKNKNAIRRDNEINNLFEKTKSGIPAFRPPPTLSRQKRN